MVSQEIINESFVDSTKELTEKVNALVQVLNEQSEKSESEKLAQEENLIKEEQKAQELEQQELEQKELEKEQLELEKSEDIEFKDSVLTALDNLDSLDSGSELLEIQGLLKEVKEQQLQVIEMYNEVLPSVKQSSDLEIIFLCLIPVFFVVKWIGSMFNSAFR